MQKTNIPWCDYTWNPITGCSPISEGCAHCYAERRSKRMGWKWGHAVFHPDRLDAPQHKYKRRPGRVFVVSMGDIGHETVLPRWRTAVVDSMLAAPWHQYIVLTKRPGPWLRELPPECWVGVSVENQYRAARLVLLYACAWPGAIQFVSVEPMLGPVTFSGLSRKPDWVIAGPETGPGKRPCDDAWIEALAKESPVFFDKRPQWTRREWPAGRPI
jgi:protein gp37